MKSYIYYFEIMNERPSPPCEKKKNRVWREDEIINLMLNPWVGEMLSLEFFCKKKKKRIK